MRIEVLHSRMLMLQAPVYSWHNHTPNTYGLSCIVRFLTRSCNGVISQSVTILTDVYEWAS